ncbi:hypothetical protein LTR56_021711 [Elasticomyces elasticus]|nr:hypothetical protein LTR56_021711 [Elasticomyces elasticus]KAK3630613.1 hypothetical protein LTR22_021415 [Elasticomyces elasticus]KAK4909143.1 hypothetical protein LTR49_022042 [Elasticomyces elasticus]KAK5749221.1 hypothetical protein LTS12_020732 [Elasticomyces elasticus]
MAGLKVLSLPELLEPILLDLSTRDLLFAQKVCKTWHEVITSTPSLQKALFFLPGTKADALRRSHDWECTCYARDPGVLRNPLLTDMINEGCLTALGGLFFLRVESLNAGPHASCHRMYLSQPPTAVRNFELEADSRTYEFRGTGGDTIKYGSVLAARQEEIDRARMRRADRAGKETFLYGS